jgi:hypothetical protein
MARHGTARPCPARPDAPQARAIAEAFRPAQAWGSRRDYYYTRGKLGSDPLYDGVLQHLPDDGQPVLDLGCGLGLFAHVLRQRGGPSPTWAWTWMPARSPAPSVPPPACPLCASTAWTCRRRCRRRPGMCCCWMCCSTWTRAHSRHCCVRPACGWPGGRLLLRTPLATGDGRDRTTRVADRLAWLVGWMGTRPRHPDPQVLQATLAEAGLQVTAPRPCTGARRSTAGCWWPNAPRCSAELRRRRRHRMIATL